MIIRNFKLDTENTCAKPSIHDHWRFQCLSLQSRSARDFLWIFALPVEASKWCQIIKGSTDCIWNCRSMISTGSKSLKLQKPKTSRPDLWRLHPPFWTCSGSWSPKSPALLGSDSNGIWAQANYGKLTWSHYEHSQPVKEEAGTSCRHARSRSPVLMLS